MGDTIGKQVRDEVRGAADDSSVVVSNDDVTVVVDVEHAERYGLGVRGLRVQPRQSTDDVGETAERIAHSVDAVDELRVVEYDKGEQEAILRSAQPQEDDKGIDYWEATVKPNETTVQRYRKTHAEPDRAVVVEPLSYGILGELVDQVADAVAPGLSSETTGDR